MNELLGNNLFYIYLFACLVVMNYSAFGKCQKIFIIEDQPGMGIELRYTHVTVHRLIRIERLIRRACS